MTAVVGNSGSGKSTLLRLLAGRVAPQAGQLSAGGHLIDNEASRRWLAAKVAYKPQEPTFLGGAIADVLRDGDTTLADETLLHAVRQAGLGPALDRNEIGLNTVLGTNGIGLSGGQRQMIALARVFAARMDILILDEPTLGLDATAQAVVLDTLKQLKTSKCLVVSTHAAEVMHAADRALVIDQGKLVADSTPAQLLGRQTTARTQPNETPPANSSASAVPITSVTSAKA
jgi:ABC-type bacteriocin/lantibiotic exporter with double-glycine peptidase domain